LHGFGEQVSFKVSRVELGMDSAAVRLVYPFSGDHPAYPFPCLFEVEYRLDTLHGFRMQLSATNWSRQAIPIGLGWHPYFQLGGKVDAWSLRLPPVEEVLVNERMIPTKEKEAFPDFHEAKRIRERSFDTCFALQNTDQANSVILEGPKGKLIYWQSSSAPYLQVFIPPSRESLALEPMSCNINAFHNGDGLKILTPGEKFSISAGVRVK
jgi:aldose 1-epimerase